MKLFEIHVFWLVKSKQNVLKFQYIFLWFDESENVNFKVLYKKMYVWYEKMKIISKGVTSMKFTAKKELDSYLTPLFP